MTKIPKKRGRPEYKAQDEDRKWVENMVMAGIDRNTIAKCLKITKPTLYKYYSEELETSHQKMISRVASALYRNALEGNVTAQIFIMKTQAHWREVDRLEHTGPDGAPIQSMFKVLIGGVDVAQNGNNIQLASTPRIGPPDESE